MLLRMKTTPSIFFFLVDFEDSHVRPVLEARFPTTYSGFGTIYNVNFMYQRLGLQISEFSREKLMTFSLYGRKLAVCSPLPFPY